MRIIRQVGRSPQVLQQQGSGTPVRTVRLVQVRQNGFRGKVLDIDRGNLEFQRQCTCCCGSSSGMVIVVWIVVSSLLPSLPRALSQVEGKAVPV